MTRKAIAPIPSWLLLFTTLLVFVLVSSTAFAAECDPIVATAVSVQGKVEVRRVDATQWQPVTLNDTFCTGDRIRVGDRSRADVALANQPVLRLDQNTTITLGGIQKEQTFLVDLVQGATYFFSRATRALDVRTAFVNAGVEGTEGLIRVGDNRTDITIFEGKVVAANDAGTLSLTGGESAVAIRGQAPAYRTLVKPRDAVHWALYYPPVIDIPPDDFAGRETNDPRVLARRAAASLAVGRVDEASADLERALKLDPRNSETLALQSIIAITQNDKEGGMALAQQAVQADPQSGPALLAMSYAQQAQFDLEGARNSLLAAVKANPNDALAWARLAEIQMSFQEMDKALEAAKRAVELNPNLARTQTVLGFAYLMQVKTGKAREAFIKAHELDQADALPKLGLGLAKMRDGEVEEGRAEMEVAASLDPNNAIIRSYLGKAFFEEKRDGPTEREYDIAKELDPKDPTPFFYHALQKQLTNRPVEALQDMEKAIELNDNRAVYRSKLSLDSDLAARSSSLARIYRNLGYEEQALIEGWTSVNRDQTSFTAHRFLADSYSALPNHEIARVSELLQSQLLQPINITPIQPSLAVSNLFLLSSLGPQSSSFNEFNTLMVNRDRLTVLGNGVIGNNDTQSGEGVVAGIYKNFSYSAGVSNFNTDGWRKNADQQDMNANAFIQWEASPWTSLQAEYRYRNRQTGDVQQRFWDSDFQPGQNDAELTHTVRLGGRHEFAPHSTVIANLFYNHSSQRTIISPWNTFPFDLGFGVPINASLFEIDGKKYETEGYSAEGQYLLRSQYFNLVTGAGFALINGTPQLTIGFDLSPIGGPPVFIPDPPFPQPLNGDLRHTNGYAYGYFKLLKNLTITAGGSYDYIDGPSDSVRIPGGNDLNQFNPKYGLIWNPFPRTTVRAAAFRTLKRSLIVDQTIEPTQVGGFNQFFDDLDSTSAWRYGGAINHKFTDTLFVGIEGTYRDTEIPFEELDDAGNLTSKTTKADQYQALAFAFYAPHPWVALKAQYIYDQYDQDNQEVAFDDRPYELYMHRVPLGVKFFHPSGFFSGLNVTYWHQKVKAARLATGQADTGKDGWALVDVAVGYRLPKRYGLITVGVQNLFDTKFNFYNTDIKNPLIQPDRLVFGQVTLALP